MPANDKTSQKKPVKRPAVRSLKIQLEFRGTSWSQRKVPVIRLGGVWLEKLGFTPEQRVIVTTMDKLLIVQPEE